MIFVANNNFKPQFMHCDFHKLIIAATMIIVHIVK